MLIDKTNFNFYHAINRGLTSCGYRSHGEGIFTNAKEKLPTDWLSVTGNAYFYIVGAGVVFPDLSSEMRDALPAQSGIAPLDGVPPSLIPFVFSPVSRYVRLPARGQNPSAHSVLTLLDAQELVQCFCKSLPQALAPFHDMEQAVAEVEETLETGGAKAFLLVLAYLRLGKLDAAANFARRTTTAFKSDNTRNFYKGFLRNIQSSYNASLC
jgi:hypothetical protein